MKKVALLVSLVALFVLAAATFQSRKTAAHTTSADPQSIRSSAQVRMLLERFQTKFPPLSEAGISLWPAEVVAYRNRNQPRQLNEDARTEASRNNDPDLGPEADGLFVDKNQYLQARAEQIAMQRGMDLDKPFDLTRRVKAISLMESQKTVLAKAAKDGKLSPEAIGTWTPIGPAFVPNGQTDTTPNPVTGRTISIDIHPTNANIAYVGTAQGGLWRTTDGGATWIPC